MQIKEIECYVEGPKQIAQFEFVKVGFSMKASVMEEEDLESAKDQLYGMVESEVKKRLKSIKPKQ